MTAGPDDGDGRPVAAVLAGAGARGAYEAGLLAGLLPALEEQGRRPTLFVGTSAGAINAALFASLAHLPAAEAARTVLARWHGIRRERVIRPAIRSLPQAGVDYLAGLLGVSQRLTALLDSTPLRHTLADPELIDWTQLHDNVRDGNAAGLAVATTEHGTHRTKIFFETMPAAGPPPHSDADRAIDYVPTTLTAEHVLASSAIPGAFPPVELTANGDMGRSWHMDGGVRLNAPLKPAIDLGASRLVIISTSPRTYQKVVRPTRRPPTLQDAVDQVFQGVLGDRMIEDILDLERTNRLVRGGATNVPTSTKNRVYHEIPYLFGGPATPGELGLVAAGAIAECLHGLGTLTHVDLALLSLVLGSGPQSRPDLISYLLFETEFLDKALVLGQRHANLVLDPTLRWE